MAGKQNYRRQIRSWEIEGFDVSELRREVEKSANRKKAGVAFAILLVGLPLSFFTYDHLWNRNQLTKHIMEAERLLEQKKYTEAWKKVEQASQYGSKEKSKELAAWTAKCEDYEQAARFKEEAGKTKAGLDLEVVKRFNLEENYQSLLFEERRGLEFFETNRFREAKNAFESTKTRGEALSSKIAELQKMEQERLERDEKERVEREKNEKERSERLRQKASKAKQEMEALKKLVEIDIQLAKRYIRNDVEALLSQESRGMKAFGSGRYEEARDLFQSTTQKYWELVYKMGEITRSEEEKAEKEKVEKLRQDTAKAKSEMEAAKNKLDLKFVEKGGWKQEYNHLLSQELKAKGNMEANRYKEAKEIFEDARNKYTELNDKMVRFQKGESEKAVEKSRQEALKAKVDMELVKRTVDVNLVQKYRVRDEFESLTRKEKEGRRFLEEGKFEEARNIFEEVHKGYGGLDLRGLRSRYCLDVVPGSIHFGNVRILGWSPGGKVRTRTIMVTNKGTKTVGIKGVAIESPTRGEFNLSYEMNNSCLPILPAFPFLISRFIRHYVMLSPGERCRQDIDFAPFQVGVRNASLTIVLDDPDSTRIKIPMVGQGM